ncbi:MAG: lytic transglycosylase domain-containing protein [Brevinematia bacterium]
MNFKRFLWSFAFVFLFSQMNLPDKIVNKSTYDYVINMSRFSFVNYGKGEVSDFNKFIDLYTKTYFDSKSITRKVRNLKGKRVWKRISILVPSVNPNLKVLPLVSEEYNKLSDSSIFKPDLGLVYADLLVEAKNYKKAMTVLNSLSNTTLYDEAIIKLAKISFLVDDFKSLEYYLNLYKLNKSENIYSPLYVILNSVVIANKGKLLDSLSNVANMILSDFTEKYDYINELLLYFGYISKFSDSFGDVEKSFIKKICFELIDYKFYKEAFKVAYYSKLGYEFYSEMLLEMKSFGIKSYKSLMNTYLSGLWRDIVLYPNRFEKKLDSFDQSKRKVLLKSLFVYYQSINVVKAKEYLEEYSKVTDIGYRVPRLAYKYIDKLLALKEYTILSSLLDDWRFDFDFHAKDADRLLFFKGYALEQLMNTNGAIEMYEKAVFTLPSGYYDFISLRKISELASENKIKSYYDKFVNPLTELESKFNYAKILFNFDKQNSETYKSFVFYVIKDKNKFLFDVPYEIVDKMADIEKFKISLALRKVTNNYIVVSKYIRSKLVNKGFSNLFSYLIVMRNRLELKATRGIYNEGNNVTANKSIEAYSKFLPFSIQEILYPIPYVSDVIYSSEKFGVDPNLVYAIMKQESFFQEGAYSRAGAIGLMQVLYSTGKLVARKFDMSDIISNRKDLFKSDINIMLGTAYLSMLLDLYGDLYHAISAYNGGAKVLKKTQRKYRVPIEDSVVFSEFLAFRETKNYIKRVVKYYNVYSSIYNFEIVKKEFNINDPNELEKLRSKLKELQESLSSEDLNDNTEDNMVGEE